LRIAQEKVGATEQRIEGEIAAIKESRAKDLSALQEAQTDLDQTVEKYGGTSTSTSECAAWTPSLNCVDTHLTCHRQPMRLSRASCTCFRCSTQFPKESQPVDKKPS